MKTKLNEYKLTDFGKSNSLKTRFHQIIPGGGHTYAKGDDQFPQFYSPYITRGKGCHIWDADGNEYIEYAMGLRAVTLGHAFDPVDNAVIEALRNGINFNRPSTIELDCAEDLLKTIDNGHEMVKFAKNGSDSTTAAIKLARAYTGRELIAVCGDHPFFSTDDWFIGSTPMTGGIPENIQKQTIKFKYNDIQSLEDLFNAYPGKIAAVIMEAEKEIMPADGYLDSVKQICQKNNAVFIFDEIIAGFRYHLGGGQKLHNIVPDLSTYGKAIANGYSLSALTGKREIMECGGINHNKERVFLLSTTYGAEHHHLAAAIATMKYYRENNVVGYLHEIGSLLRAKIEKVIRELSLEEYFTIKGRSCALLYGTLDNEKKPSQLFRTLFLQETIKRGMLAPSLLVSYSHTDEVVQITSEIIYDALVVYRKALAEGVEKYLEGKPVKPVFRKYC